MVNITYVEGDLGINVLIKERLIEENKSIGKRVI
jgi:hypothetical protein